MYAVLWSILGLLIVGAALADAFWTTLTVSGAGWLSAAVAGRAGRGAMRGPAWMAENASVVAACASFALWAALLWVGWTLVFCGSSEATLDAKTMQPASLVGRAYFAGFTLTTLGIGDIVPGQGVWQLATTMAAASGLLMATLCVTYAFSVITALNARRSIGAAVAHLGASPEAILSLLRDGGAQPLSAHLQSLTNQLQSAAMQHGAYPVLAYSHVSEFRRSFARAVAILGEASILLEYAIERGETLPPAVYVPLREAVELTICDDCRVRLANEALAGEADLEELRAAGVSIAPGAEDALREETVQALRRRWAEWLRWHGHEWADLRRSAPPRRGSSPA